MSDPYFHSVQASLLAATTAKSSGPKQEVDVAVPPMKDHSGLTDGVAFQGRLL